MQKYRETVGSDFSLSTESVERVLSYPATTLELTSTNGYLISLGYNMEVAKSKALELKPHLKNYIDKAEDLYNSMI